LFDRHATADMHDAADALTGHLADYPPDTYRHHGMAR
jgi:hypothetical protein